jgi:hypothetical protein
MNTAAWIAIFGGVSAILSTAAGFLPPPYSAIAAGAVAVIGTVTGLLKQSPLKPGPTP